MLERSSSADALRDPKSWVSRRKDYARAALRAGDWALAEKLAAHHYLPEGDEDGYDLDWLAGYAALRAGAPDRAAQYFALLPVEEARTRPSIKAGPPRRPGSGGALEGRNPAWLAAWARCQPGVE